MPAIHQLQRQFLDKCFKVELKCQSRSIELPLKRGTLLSNLELKDWDIEKDSLFSYSHSRWVIPNQFLLAMASKIDWVTMAAQHHQLDCIISDICSCCSKQISQKAKEKDLDLEALATFRVEQEWNTTVYPSFVETFLVHE